MVNSLYRELTFEEMSECSGGLLPLLPVLAFLGSCLAGGYAFGKDCAERDNRSKK